MLPTDLPQLLMLLVWVPVVAIVHELGHAVAAGPGGYRVTSFGIGRGRPLFRWTLPGGVVFHVGWLFFTGGACVAIPRSPGGGPRSALFHGGGVGAQLLLAILLWILQSIVDDTWLRAGAHFNLLVIGWNLLPWRTARMASDGWWLLSRLTRGAVAPHRALFEQRESIQLVLAYEERVQSPIGIWYGHRMLAWCDILAGRLASAIERLGTVPPLSVAAPYLENIDRLIRAEAQLRSGQPMVAIRTIATARAKGMLPNDTADLMVVVEARAWLQLGDLDRARGCVATLAGVGGAIGREVTSVALDIALQSGDESMIIATATRLSRDSTAGLFDPLTAARALTEAARQTGDRGIATRWHARAVGLTRAALHRASAVDKPAIQQQLDQILDAGPVSASQPPACTKATLTP